MQGAVELPRVYFPALNCVKSAWDGQSFFKPEMLQDSDIYAEIFHSPQVFKLNYAQMEREFKAFVYPDGDPNSYYQTPSNLTETYASEGYFFQSIKKSMFLTNGSNMTHLFFIPISCHQMRGKLGISTIVKMHVEKLISKYPYWNKTQGVGHFFVTCHDIGVRVTKGVHPLMENSIRVVCLSQHGSGYMPHKMFPPSSQWKWLKE
ncbi:probable glycosyltransferase At3g07620 [Pistacia vera]|uniref:probable glycosyltransferase At3g07620 n=1 Tax=Pistacia vera TaxID=55513 RepID=UPI00126345C3|nr:probable glycosyltransferase At3g07620 [Pistacia vera]